jgi:hypothetical protein
MTMITLYPSGFSIFLYIFRLYIIRFAVSNINKSETDDNVPVYFLYKKCHISNKEADMKNVGLFLILLLVVPACAIFNREERKPVAVVHNTDASDSTEYELVVFDQGFETWLLMQPSQQYSLEHYKAKNRIYVSEWNYRYMSPSRYGSQYGSYLDYDYFLDYGLEFERRLFYYFKYFEESNGVSLDPGGR